MCFFSAPEIKTPEAPPPPRREDPEIATAEDDARRRARAAGGRRSTILTGGLGDSSFGQSVQRRTMLGSA